jgi:predicted TIM-barrel fold metal-dependent hydrolase
MNPRLHEGRDEEIVEPDLPIIDAHHHVFERPGRRYMFDEFLADATAGHNIVGSVYVEMQSYWRPDGPEVLRPIGEIEFANGIAAMSASGIYGPRHLCAAIVGYADLRFGDEVALLLDRALEIAPDRFRAIRQTAIDYPSDEPYKFMTNPPPRGLLTDERFICGFGQLGRRGLVFDAAVFHNQLGDIERLAAEHSDTVIALNHIGIAMSLGQDVAGRKQVFETWREGLRNLARLPNVVCKIGGLGLPFWGFGFENQDGPVSSDALAAAWKPYVEVAIEAFGVDRCMMQSDYPADARSCGYVPLWNALKKCVAGCSENEKMQLFAATAARVYRIDQRA